MKKQILVLLIGAGICAISPVQAMDSGNPYNIDTSAYKTVAQKPAMTSTELFELQDTFSKGTHEFPLGTYELCIQDRGAMKAILDYLADRIHPGQGVTQRNYEFYSLTLSEDSLKREYSFSPLQTSIEIKNPWFGIEENEEEKTTIKFKNLSNLILRRVS